MMRTDANVIHIYLRKQTAMSIEPCGAKGTSRHITAFFLMHFLNFVLAFPPDSRHTILRFLKQKV